MTIISSAAPILDSAGRRANGRIYFEQESRFVAPQGLVTTTRGVLHVRDGVLLSATGGAAEVPATPEDRVTWLYEEFDGAASLVKWATVIPDVSEVGYSDLPEVVPPSTGQGAPAWASEVLNAVATVETLKTDAETAKADAETASSAAQQAVVQVQQKIDSIPEHLDTEDGAIAALVGTASSQTAVALSATIAPVVLGRSVTDFGVAVGATAAQNVTGFRAAVAWAESNPIGARTLFVPPVGPDEFYAVNDDITLTGAGVAITGAGTLSRVKQTARTKAIFRSCGAGQRFENFHVIGADDRDATPDAGGAEMIRDQHPFANHVGVAFQHGSDGSRANGISGENINAVVASWAWSDDTGAYVSNIQGLTIQNIHATNVWVAVFCREVDNLTVENVSGTFARLPLIFADPHLIYLTSSNYVGSLRPLYSVRVSNVRSYDSVGGEPVAIKNVYGGSLSGVNVKNTPGVLVLAEVNNFTVEPYVAEEIWKDPASVGTAHSPSGGQQGMLTFSDCKNVTVAPGSRQKNKAGNQARAIVFASTPESENVTILEPDIETSHAGNDTADTRAEIALHGKSCRVVRPRIRMLGGHRHGIRMGGTSPEVVNPEIIGCAQAVITNACLGGKVFDYTPAKIVRANTTGSPIRVSASSDVLAEVLTTPPAAAAFDRGLIASPSNRLIKISSGDAPTLYGAAFSAENGRWKALSASATLPRYAVFERGSADAYVESDVWLGARDAGGSGTFSVGHALRVVAEDVNLLCEVREDRLTVTYRAAGGLTLTSVASVLGTYQIGRRYRMRSVVFGNMVQVFIDSLKIVEATLTPEQVTALAAGTKHGIVERQSLASAWADFRSDALA